MITCPRSPSTLIQYLQAHFEPWSLGTVTQWMHAPGQTTRTTPIKSKVATQTKEQANNATKCTAVTPMTLSKLEPHQEANTLWENEVMCAGEAYTGNKNSVYVPYTFINGCMMTEEHALLDSGATDNFIDHRTAQQLSRLGTWTSLTIHLTLLRFSRTICPEGPFSLCFLF